MFEEAKPLFTDEEATRQAQHFAFDNGGGMRGLMENTGQGEAERGALITWATMRERRRVMALLRDVRKRAAAPYAFDAEDEAEVAYLDELALLITGV